MERSHGWKMYSGSRRGNVLLRAGLASATLYGVILACVALTAMIRPVEAKVTEDAPQAANLAPAETLADVPETIEAMVRRLATEYGVSPDRAVAIATCESSLDPSARNRQGSSATGLYQWTAPTWEWIGSPGDRLDAEDNARAFMEWYPRYPHWWQCQGLMK